MEPRERLRRYLEQRREMGESDLILDSMTVDEVLAIVAGAEAQGPPSPREEHIAAAPGAPPDVTDWRDVLRSASGKATVGDRPQRIPPLETVARGREGAAHAVPPVTPSVTESDAPPPGITVGSSARELFGGPMAHLSSLEDIATAVHGCRRCPLFATATHGVPGEGPPGASVMIVGEAPGASEDETGRPFVGAAGQLLTKILAAVDLRREEVFICNVLKHRPPGNRNPNPDEVAACGPYLVRQIELIRPKVILALGTFAAQTLLATKLSIGKLRGQLHRYHGVPLIVTYHPAALLRNPGWKRPTWEDVQLARRVLDRAADGA